MVKKTPLSLRKAVFFCVFFQDVTHVNPRFCKNGAYVNCKKTEFVCIMIMV